MTDLTTTEELFVVVDVEATGLDVLQDRVVQIALQVQNAQGDILQAWDTLVHPGRPVGATEYHGLTDADLTHAPTFDQIATQFAAFLEGRIFVAHNAGYDVGILREEFSRSNQAVKVLGVLCTLDLARRHLELPVNTLSILADRFQIIQHQAHEAKDDTRVLGRILPHLLGFPWRDRLQSWQNTTRSRNTHLHKLPPVVEILPCSWANPGEWTPGMDLMEGMRVALTGGTDQERIAATVLAQEKGLGIASSVTSTTSLVVLDDKNSKTSKAKKARGLNKSMLSYPEFMTLLESVQPGAPA